MWILPSRARPKRAAKFFEEAVKYGLSSPGILALDNSETELWEYDSIKLPKNWKIEVFNTQCIGDISRCVLKHYPNLQWYGLISDDLIPETMLWDSKMLGSLTGKNFISANDGWQSPVRMGASVFSGDLVRAAGYLYPEKMKHYFMDDVWEQIGRDFGVWGVLMDVIIRHDHHQKPGNGDLIDETYRRAAPWMEEDRNVFETWKRDEYPKIKEKIRKFLS